MKSIVRCLALLALLLFPGSYAYSGPDDWGDATLTICNKGTADIHVVVAVSASVFFNSVLKVSGWTNLSPGDCKRVYSEAGTPANGSDSAYIGFGFLDSQNHITAGHIEQVPDFGQFPFGTKVLTKSNRRLCVRNEGMSYLISGDPACESFHSDKNDPGGYVPLASALYISPIPRECNTFNRQTSCFGGDYYLNIKPTANDRELHASAGSADTGIGVGKSPDAPTAGGSLGQFLAFAEAARVQTQRKNVRAYIAAADTGFESYKQGAPQVNRFGDRYWSAKEISLPADSCLVTESATNVNFRCLAFTSSSREGIEARYTELVKNVAAALPEDWKPYSGPDIPGIFNPKIVNKNVNMLAGTVFGSSSGLKYYIWTLYYDSQYELGYQVLAPRRPGDGTRNAAPSKPVPAPNRSMTPDDDPIGEGGFITPYVVPKK